MKRSFEEMSEKTPVSVLQELCIQQEHGAPYYEVINNGEDDEKSFTFLASAFDMMARGTGRSKKEAKHEAAANLISMLKKLDRFKHLLKQTPQTPRPTSDSDAVGTLLDICVQRNWPLATFDVKQAYGQPHAPEFTVVCRLASIERQGTFSTKKGAKQIAAQMILNVVQSLPNENDADKQVATLEAEPPEKYFRTYREYKNLDIKPTPVRLSKRREYFLRFPAEKKQKVLDILNESGAMFSGHSKRDMVDLICKELDVPYEVKDMIGHPKNFKMFVMKGEYDCVHVGNESILWDSIIDYFKVMFNVTKFHC